jgi:hypothetical protein
LFKVLFAKIYVKPTRNVAETFRTKKAAILVLTMPVIRGLISAAPKYMTPTTVVMASIEPSKIRKKLGNSSDFNVYIEAFPSPQNRLPLAFKNQIPEIDIFPKTNSKAR